MSTILIIFLIISLFFGGTVYLVTNSVYFAGGVLIISIIYFVFRALPKIKQSNIKSRRFHECYHFINTYIVSLSIKGSIKAAYQDTENTMDDFFKKTSSCIEELNDKEKLNYITQIFPFHIYSLFLNVVDLWIEEGGDILKMSNQLINETRNVEEYLLAVERMSRKKYIEFSVLWFIAVAILIFLKFALKDFYSKLTGQIFFPIAVSAIFIFILVSIDLLLQVTTNVELKGWSNREKES